MSAAAAFVLLRSIYDADRLLVAVRECAACGFDHPELEFKRFAATGEDAPRYRARCAAGRQWVYLDGRDITVSDA